MNVNDSIKILNNEYTKRILNAFTHTEEIREALSVLIEFVQSQKDTENQSKDFVVLL